MVIIAKKEPLHPYHVEAWASASLADLKNPKGRKLIWSADVMGVNGYDAAHVAAHFHCMPPARWQDNGRGTAPVILRVFDGHRLSGVKALNVRRVG